MNIQLHRKNMQVVADALSGEGGYSEQPDVSYGTLFQFEFTPCCIPLPVLVWINPQSEGVFVRVIFPQVGDLRQRPQLLGILNNINYNLPAGGFAADLQRGEVRFKNTLFFGNTELAPSLFIELIQSSFDMVRVNFSAIIGAVTGVGHKCSS
jgi:hypothetical protein